MARGNQRDRQREKAAKRNEKNAKGKKPTADGLTAAQRQERDRKIMMEKQAKAEAAKAAGNK